MTGPSLGAGFVSSSGGSSHTQFSSQETDRATKPTDSSCWPSPRPLGYTGFSESTGVLHLPGTQDYSCAHKHTPLHKAERTPCSLPTPPGRSLGCLCIPVPARTIYSQCCWYCECDNQGHTRSCLREGVRQKREGFQLGLLPLSPSKD